MSVESARPDDARRLVLGAAVKMPIDEVRVFIESLRGSGYAGDVTLLARPLQWRLKSYLAGHGVRTFHSYSTRRISGRIHAYRFKRFADYLHRYGGRYDQVLVSDVRDVVFQKHPFDGISSTTCHFFLESAAWTIATEPYNRLWSQMFLTPDEAQKIAGCRITCCGVTLGGTDEMVRYLDTLVAAIQSLPWRLRAKIGADTAFHNRMAHLTREVRMVLVENNLHVATMGLEPESVYCVDERGQIRTTKGHLPAILHQYDRHAALRAAIEAHYTS